MVLTRKAPKQTPHPRQPFNLSLMNTDMQGSITLHNYGGS
jgi:hypothetical protein